MGIENRNLNNLGRSGNAAGGNIGISRDQNITQNQELNNNLNVGPIIINNYTTQINILREPPLAPANPAAAFLNQAAPLCSDILFDDRLGGYTDIQGSKSLTDYLVKIWVETLPLLSQLSGVEVESFFTSQDKDSQKYHAPKDPLEDVEISIQKMIKEALRRSKNVYTTRSNVSPFLISIKENFGCYMTWVGLLPYQDGKSGLCVPFEYILSDVLDDTRIDLTTLEVLADITIAFFKAKNYMKLYSARRLTVSLHQHTAEIFSSLALLLKELLSCAKSKLDLTDKQKQTLEDLAESFSDNIDRTEDVARCTNNSSDLNSGYNLRSGDKKLDVVHNFLRFLKPHVGSCHDVSEEVGTGVREYQRKLKRLTQYLAYDGDRNMKDIRRLALPYGIESYHLEKLTGLTKRTEFQNWLREDRVSTRLLIQGHFETSDTPSPLSHLCARFPGEYLRRGQTGIIFLHYFCHIQFNRRGMMANACDIASSFIGQLIHNTQLAPVIDIRFLKPLQMEKIKKQNFEKILELLVKILHQISDENVVIFCFIDSISVYESRPRLRLTLKFFEQLFKFLKPRSSRRRNGASRIIWKLLVTESRRTNYIYKYFKGPGETLNVYE